MNANHGTQIDWTHLDGYRGETWNPITGCSKVSAGCANCYAERLINTRQSVNPKSVRYGHKFNELMFHAERLDRPLRWKKPRAIFVNSLSDLFHEAVSFEQMASIFGVMAATHHHRYFVVTKRPDRMLEFFEWLNLESEDEGFKIVELLCAITAHTSSLEVTPVTSSAIWPLPNVAFLVSVEDQKSADERIPLLLQAKASGWIKWAGVSAEPLLGPVSLLDIGERKAEGTYYFSALSGEYHYACGDPAPVPDNESLDLVIVGGESGPRARPMHPDWVRSIRDQCAEAGVPFWFKQWGEWAQIDQAADNSRIGSGAVEKCPSFGGKFFMIGKKAAGDLLDGKRHKDPIKGFGVQNEH